LADAEAAAKDAVDALAAATADFWLTTTTDGMKNFKQHREHTRCEGTNHDEIETAMQCKDRAVELGHDYSSFTDSWGYNKCTTADDCTKAVSERGWTSSKRWYGLWNATHSFKNPWIRESCQDKEEPIGTRDRDGMTPTDYYYRDGQTIDQKCHSDYRAGNTQVGEGEEEEEKEKGSTRRRRAQNKEQTPPPPPPTPPPTQKEEEGVCTAEYPKCRGFVDDSSLGQCWRTSDMICADKTCGDKTEDHRNKCEERCLTNVDQTKLWRIEKDGLRSYKSCTSCNPGYYLRENNGNTRSGTCEKPLNFMKPGNLNTCINLDTGAKCKPADERVYYLTQKDKVNRLDPNVMVTDKVKEDVMTVMGPVESGVDLFAVCRTVKEVVCIKRENSGNPFVECDTHSENECLKVCRGKFVPDLGAIPDPKDCHEALCEGDSGTEMCKAVSIML